VPFEVVYSVCLSSMRSPPLFAAVRPVCAAVHSTRLCAPLSAAVCHDVCPSVCRYTHEYGVKKERFNHSLFLVFFQCIGNAAFALACTNSWALCKRLSAQKRR
jgi:hypothetical protein